MSDELLPYYERELGYLRQVGAEFAQAHPKIAGRLRLGADAVEDPHVSRLVESVAFLNARIRKKLDDDLPEVTDALLSVLAPHQLAPLPSMSVVQFECDPEQTTKFDIPVGTSIESDRAYGHPCTFQTGYDTTAWPLTVSAANLRGAPFQAPDSPKSGSAAAVLHLVLRPASGQCPISELNPTSLRFFLAGQPARVHELYELILGHTVEVAVASSMRDQQPWFAEPSRCVRAVGFDPDEALLPTSDRSHPGFGLLMEYFAFPSKFLFVDICNLDAAKVSQLDEELHLFLYLDRGSSELEHSVGPESFALGCAPVINLFERRAEPVELNHHQSEYQVLPDARHPDANEVFSIDEVQADSRDGRSRTFSPFYGIDHQSDEGERGAYWFSTRHSSPQAKESGQARTDVQVALVDLDHQTTVEDDWVLTCKLTCLNADLPARLPFGGDQPQLGFVDGGAGIRTLRCMLPMTRTLRPALGERAQWKVVSTLALNHLSMIAAGTGAAALKEILRTHDVLGSPANRGVIDAIIDCRSRPAVLRQAYEGVYGFSQGTEVTIELNEERLGASGAYLFASILARFLGGYCAVNSFVQLVTVFTQRGETIRWDARSGNRALI